MGSMERIRASVPLCRKDARRSRPRSLARPLSGPRRRLGFPLTRVWRLRQPRVEGRGRRSGVGLGRERRKEGGDCDSPWPVAQKRATCRQGHSHTHAGDGAGPGPGGPLRGTSIHKLGLDPSCASSLPIPHWMPGLLAGSVLPTGEIAGSQGEIRAPL